MPRRDPFSKQRLLVKVVVEAHRHELQTILKTVPIPISKQQSVTRIVIRVMDIPKPTPRNSLGIEP